MDIARVLIRVPQGFSLPESLSVSIDEDAYDLILRGDTFGRSESFTTRRRW